MLFLYTLWLFNDGALTSTQNDADIADNVVKYIFFNSTYFIRDLLHRYDYKIR